MLIENLLSKDDLEKYKWYLEQKVKSLGGSNIFNEFDSIKSAVIKKSRFRGKIINLNPTKIKFSFRYSKDKEQFEELVTVGATGNWQSDQLPYHNSISCNILSFKKQKAIYIVEANIDTNQLSIGDFGSFSIGDNFIKLYTEQIDIIDYYLKNLQKNLSVYKDYQEIFGIDEEEVEEDFQEDPYSHSGLKIEKLEKPIKNIKKAIAEKKSKDLQGKFDNYQSYALESLNQFIRSNIDYADYRLVWGPPGTGKTELISRLCLDNYTSTSILITSFTNVAVDNALERIADNLEKIKIPSMDVISRFGGINKISPKMQGYNNLKPTAKIWGSTLDYALLNFKSITFDIIIIDEASMVSLPKVLFTFLRSQRVILIGDFLQLHPFDDFKDMEFKYSKTDIDKMKILSSFSYFSYLCYYSLVNFSSENLSLDNRIYPLVTNRRSYLGLIKYSNEKLYQGLMDFPKQKQYTTITEHHPSIPPLLKKIFFNGTDLPVLIIPSEFSNFKMESCHIRRTVNKYSRSGSYGNLGQIAITIQLIRQLLSKSFQKDIVVKDRIPREGILYIKEIGVIAIFNFHIQIIKQWLWNYGESLYRSSENKKLAYHDDKEKELVNTINELLTHYYKKWVIDNLEVGTVEKFQGREKDFIITNTVFHPAVQQRKKIQSALRDRKKLNVILTRARYCHLIVSSGYGNYSDGNLYKDLFNFNLNPPKYIVDVKLNKTEVLPLRDLDQGLDHDKKLESLVKEKANINTRSTKTENQTPFMENGQLVEVVKEITGAGITIGTNGALKIEESKTSEEQDTDEGKYDNSITNIYYRTFLKDSKLKQALLENFITEEIIKYWYDFFENDIKEDPKHIYEFGEFLLSSLLDSEIINILKNVDISNEELTIEKLRARMNKI